MAFYLINYGLIVYILVLSQLFRFTKSTKHIFYLLTFIYFTWFIGLRHEVGAD
ncbi:MAG: hypothetical protein RMI30_01040 [Thermodesulfovibrio sp.]|nr:hypothetical protein [Thermodesulfovibrio sp.]